MKKKSSRRQIDVNVDELDRIIDDAMRAPLNETDGGTLKTAVHAMAERLVRQSEYGKDQCGAGANAQTPRLRRDHPQIKAPPNGRVTDVTAQPTLQERRK